MPIFKKKKTMKDIKKEHENLSFVQEQQRRRVDRLKKLDPESSEYEKLYKEYVSAQGAELNDENLKSKRIENENKSQETILKKKEIRAGIIKTAISSASAVLAAIIIPIVEQRVGPAMSKLSSHAMSAIFKAK